MKYKVKVTFITELEYEVDTEEYGVASLREAVNLDVQALLDNTDALEEALWSKSLSKIEYAEFEVPVERLLIKVNIPRRVDGHRKI